MEACFPWKSAGCSPCPHGARYEVPRKNFKAVEVDEVNLAVNALCKLLILSGTVPELFTLLEVHTHTTQLTRSSGKPSMENFETGLKLSLLSQLRLLIMSW